MTRIEEMKLFYQRTLIIWEEFCRLHNELYDLACEEYITLLDSNIDKLESMLPIKEEMIGQIGKLEKERSELIEDLNQSNIFNNPISKAGDLLVAFAGLEKEASIPALKNYNELLLDIISKIQDQNKKNQIFLNKAMLSLREIKQGFTGKKTYTTYGADGMTRTMAR